ncbi:hypothetical protein AKJ09_06580 [Labilithrix luteola]|uniref:Uncharacterized protein n=1 Tax=Labilithrix luteola TaxID=1391654 RepID=A0A0K1Q2P8_9BACT|nr:hypothetical protein AKJ09_06580 [Labilithrix luteola]
MLLAVQALLLQSRDNAIRSAENRTDIHASLREKAIQEEHDARLEEAKERSKDGGFFSGIATAFEALTVDVLKGKSIEDCLDKAGDATINSRQFWADLEKGALEVGKWAAVAGSVALAVVSLGSAAPVAALAIAGAVLSCASTADSEFGIMEKMGVDKETAGWIDVGMAIGGALCGGAAGLAGGAKAATSLGQAAKIGGLASEVVGAGSSFAGAGAKIGVATFERRAKLAAADAEDATNTKKQIEKRMDALTDSLKDTMLSQERGLQRVSEALANYGQSTLATVRA